MSRPVLGGLVGRSGEWAKALEDRPAGCRSSAVVDDSLSSACISVEQDGDCAQPSGGGSIYVVTDDPDAVFARATASGATVVREIRDEDYGNRTFTVRDPEGNLWSFGTYPGC